MFQQIAQRFITVEMSSLARQPLLRQRERVWGIVHIRRVTVECVTCARCNHVPSLIEYFWSRCGARKAANAMLRIAPAYKVRALPRASAGYLYRVHRTEWVLVGNWLFGQEMPRGHSVFWFTLRSAHHARSMLWLFLWYLWSPILKAAPRVICSQICMAWHCASDAAR